MDRSSTVARFIQRFREAAPLSPDERRRDRDAMEGQFWWSPSSKDSDIKTDRPESGCGTPPPPTQDATNRYFEASQSRGTRAASNRDLEASRSRGRAPPPPPYAEHTPLNSSEHNKIVVEASCIVPAPQDARSEFEGGCSPNEHEEVEASWEDAARQDACVQSEGGCQPNTGRGQTTLSPPLLSPGSAGPPGPPSDDGGGGLDGLRLVHQLHQVHRHTFADEAEVGGLAAYLPEHQAAASTFGASSRRLPAERSVGAIQEIGAIEGIEGEGFDELANLDARASSLLEHCRKLLSAPPTDDADQEATHPLPDLFSARGVGGRSSAVDGVGVVDYASSHSHTRQGLEQRAWMLLDNREPLEPREANPHGSLRVLPTGGDIDLSPAVCSHRYDQASPVLSRRYDETGRQTTVPIEVIGQQTVPTEGLAQQTAPMEGLARARNAEVSATDGNAFNTDDNTFNTDGSTFRKSVSGLLDGGESRAGFLKGDDGNDSRSLRNEGDDCGDSRSRLLQNEFPVNPALPSCMVRGTDEAHTCGRRTDQIHKQCDRELALPELNSATGDLLTGMDSVLSKFTEDEIPLGFDGDGPVNVPDATDFRHHSRTTHTSSAAPSCAVSSSFGLGRNRSQQDVSAITPSARGGRQDDSFSAASLKFCGGDPVVVALLERARQIEAELERRRLFGIFDGNHPPPKSHEKVGPDGLH